MRTVFISILITLTALDSVSQFVDITDDVNLNHAHVQAQLFGGGIAAFDFDGDGFEDLFLTGGEGEDKLFLNNRMGGYEDISDVLPHNQFKSEITSGVTYADFNKDGCVDLFITSFNREENCILLQNDCNGGFKEVTNRAGIIENSASIGATVIDYDLDGDLDIYVINYIWSSNVITNEEGETIGFDHTCAPNYLYENEGNMRFREVSGILGAQGNGCALAVTSFNFVDGRPGIYIANDFGEWIQPNELLVYDSITGRFTDVAPQFGLDYGLYGMGIAIDDPDRDDDFDIYVSNLGQNAYLVNDGNNQFIEKSIEFGIDNTHTPDTSLAVSWGVIFSDFNNDMWPDLFVANGWIPSASFIKTSFIDPCKYYNNSNGTFDDFSDQLELDF
ncbi:MAG: VCBS repeat-containing protein, partial [Saprospiraceae bacterium]|nr:VCBS repeat-containing protein [Saprospiraceae bacterium]